MEQRKRKTGELQSALEHPVFVQAQATNMGINVQDNGSAPRAQDPARRPIAEGILRFFDMANNYWADYAAASAPELNILMDLYVNEQDRRPVSVGDACIAARVPSTSALRSIDGLIGSGMLVRYPDPRDSRRKLLELTEHSRTLVRDFVDEVGAQSRSRRPQ